MLRIWASLVLWENYLSSVGKDASKESRDSCCLMSMWGLVLGAEEAWSVQWHISSGARGRPRVRQTQPACSSHSRLQTCSWTLRVFVRLCTQSSGWAAFTSGEALVGKSYFLAGSTVVRRGGCGSRVLVPSHPLRSCQGLVTQNTHQGWG